MRQKIMALRDDPKVNADMAGAFTRSNATRLENMIGRAPNDGELYMAHFLGAGGAAKLINLTSSNGSASAARAFPAAAHANRSIFYDRSGHAKSVNHVYAAIMQRYDTARSNAASMIANMNMTPNPAVPALPPGTTTLAAQEIAPVSRASSTGPIFHSMFTSDGRSGAVSNLVRELWASRPRVAAALTGIPVDAVTNASSTTAADATGKRSS
jgi:hypothetical protein